MLLREIKEGLNNWGDISCSWVSDSVLVRLQLYTKLFYRFNAIPVKTLTGFFSGEIYNLIMKFVWKYKGLSLNHFEK